MKSGVVVVAAAGNAGGALAIGRARGSTTGWCPSPIPATPRAPSRLVPPTPSPYRHGPIGLSSRGPTADGRHKPDLLAPGRQVVRAGARRWLRVIASGTSQAAVSGVASRLLARFPEAHRAARAGEADLDVLGVLTWDDCPISRGSGLVDALRAMQATWIRGGVP